MQTCSSSATWTREASLSKDAHTPKHCCYVRQERGRIIRNKVLVRSQGLDEGLDSHLVDQCISGRMHPWQMVSMQELALSHKAV